MIKKPLTDISKSLNTHPTTLSAVGMEEMQLLINGQSGLAKVFVQFKDSTSRGIHMSRLYKLLRDHFNSSNLSVENTENTESLKNTKNLKNAKNTENNNNLSFKSLENLLKEMLKSHEGQTDQAYLVLQFPLTIKRKSLVSKEWGLRSYPLKIKVSLNTNNELKVFINFELMYSSTCPCSASLAQELNKEALLKQFKGKENIAIKDVENWFSNLENAAAFPHAQRSKAHITLLINQKLTVKEGIELITLEINKAEETLQTVVQAFVKREDEQAFAHLNAKSPLFCEDAARKLKLLYNKENYIQDFSIKVSHEESLHPHNAVSFAFKPHGDFFKSKDLFILT